jgi:hypothetical protein
MLRPLTVIGVDTPEFGFERKVTLADQRLYQLIRQPVSIGRRPFAIELLDAGAEAYCFTFA